jgi:hypothetical protein
MGSNIEKSFLNIEIPEYIKEYIIPLSTVPC